jgi:hypothetical protein
LNPIHILTLYFFNTHFNIILSYTPVSQVEFSLQVFRQILYAFHTYHACYMPCPSHPPWIYLTNIILWSVQSMKLLTVQVFLSSCYYFSFLSAPVLTQVATWYFLGKLSWK